jgi:histone H3/H4
MSTPATNLSHLPAGVSGAAPSGALSADTATMTSATSATGAATGAAPSSKGTKKATAKKAAGSAATKAKAPKKPSAPRTKKPSASASGGASGTGKKTSGGGSGGNNAASAAAAAAANADAIMADAAIARLDLAKQRSIAIQRKSDPMWYRIEDIVLFTHPTMINDSNHSMSNNNVLPEQISVVERALSYAGGLNRSDVTPQAMMCLLEQARRIAYELITDAQDYAYAAGRSDITQADLVLAQELRSDVSTSSNVTTQLPKLNLTAQQVNRAPLPPIPTQCYSGVVLPPKAHQLTARTFDVVSASMVAQKMTEPVPKSPATLAALAQNKQKQSDSASSGGYGASRGRQIPITLKSNVSAATANGPVIAAGVSPIKDSKDISEPTTSAPSNGTGVSETTVIQSSSSLTTTATSNDVTSSVMDPTKVHQSSMSTGGDVSASQPSTTTTTNTAYNTTGMAQQQLQQQPPPS